MIGGTLTASRTTTRWLWVLVWVGVMAGTFWGELLPSGSVVLDLVGRFGDKFLHYSSYMLLGFIPMMGFGRQAGAACALAMIPAGVLLEFLQPLVPGRTFEIADVAANTMGVFTGLTVAVILRKAKARA